MATQPTRIRVFAQLYRGAFIGWVERSEGARRAAQGHNGVGVRLGLEGERFRHKSRCFFYGKTYVNFIAGESNAKFDQGQTFDASVVDTLWEAGRIISIYDLELGFGHVSKSGCCSWNVGYSFSAWTNVVQTDEFINAVQTNNFLDLGDILTFDGLVCRLEGRY